MAVHAVPGRADIEDVFTLTPLQQGMLSYALAGLHGFDERSLTSLGGLLNHEAFAAAWQAVVDRHPALRTTFVWDRIRVPHQIVFRRATLRIRHVDCSALDAASRERHLRKLLAARAAVRLDRPPLTAVLAVWAGPRRVDVLWAISHLVTDAFSFSVIVGDLLQRYRSALEGRPWDTGRAPSLRTYVAWLKRQDASGAAAEWDREVAAGATPPGVPLAARGASTPRRTVRVLTLPEDLSAELQVCAARQRLSPFILYLGSWALVQSAATMTPSPLVAVVTAARSLPVPGIDDVVGPVMNSVPVRVDVPEREPVVSWLRRLGGDVARQLRFEYVPFQQLEQTCAARGLRIEVAFNYLNVNRRAIRGHGFAVVDYRQVLSSNFPIGVDVIPGVQTQIQVSCEPSIAAAGDVDRLLRQWRETLALIPRHEGSLSSLDRAGARAAADVLSADVARRRRSTLPVWVRVPS